MLAKLTSKNQLTLPKAAVQEVGAAEYFDVDVRAGQIVLTPVRVQRGDAVRAKLAALGISEADVGNAVDWARSASGKVQVAEPSANYSVKKTSGGASAKKKKSERRA